MFERSKTVMQRCDQLACYSEEQYRLTRRFLTPPMKSVHRELEKWMIEAGLSVRLDAVGNIVGHRTAAEPGVDRVLLMGSHLDSVPNAGKYDGMLGVLVAIAVIEAIKEDSLPFAVDVIGFSEEEGVRYSLPYLGSRAVAGTFETSWLDRQDESGITMREAIVDFGQDPAFIPQAAYDPEKVIGYLEIHLEQGPVLEKLGLPVAVVDAIAGQSRLVLRMTGNAGHAGTTPMEMRQDALVGAARWVLGVQSLGRRTEGLRATVGRFDVAPNASNVIPSQVEFTLDVRHQDDSIRLKAVHALLELGRDIANQDGLQFAIIHRNESLSVKASPKLVNLLSQSVAATGIESYTMASGAGHDAVVLADRFPVAMLFVRHPGGISHHPDERVDECDVAIAIEVMVNMLQRMAKREYHE